MNLAKKIIASIFLPTTPLNKYVIEANSIVEIKKIFGWSKSPIYERPDIYDFNYIEDINERRIRDSEVISTVTCNAKPGTIVEIGTSTGAGTVLIAKNAPKSHVYTINIPPDEILTGKGGINTTIALNKTEIGKEYKQLNLTNITQVYENTKTWKPDIGQINIAFIDGCHDANFVYSDTLKILRNMPSGGFIMWHDFNPLLRNKFHWIDDVCSGIEKLYQKRHLTEKIILLKDSWTGLYQVP